MKRPTRTWIAVTSCVLTLCAFSCGKNFELGLLVPMDTLNSEEEAFGQGHLHEGRYYASAIVLALNKVKNDSLLPGHDISFILEDTTCDELTTLRALTRLIYEEKVSAVIGPGCHCVTSARVAASFNVPMISYMCTSPEVSKKDKYPTFARTNAVHSQVAPSVIAMLEHFGWNRVGIVCEDSPPWTDACTFLFKEMKAKQLDPVLIEKAIPPIERFQDSFVDKPFENDTRATLKIIKDNARIVILGMSYGSARVFMLRASEANMTTGEEYVYIFLGTDETDMYERLQQQFMWLQGLVPETYNRQCDIWKAYGSMFILTSKPPKLTEDIEDEIMKLIKDPPFNSTAYASNTTNTVGIKKENELKLLALGTKNLHPKFF